MSNRIARVDDLVSWHLLQQDTFARLIPPGLDVLQQPGMPELLVLDSDSLDWEPDFLNALAKIAPTYRYSVPTYDLSLQETVQGTIEIRDSADTLVYVVPAPNDYQPPYEALFLQNQFPLSHFPELARYHLKANVVLLPMESVEHYLFAKAKVAEAVALAREESEPPPPMMMMGEGGGDELRITGMSMVSNALLLEVGYPESYSGSVWSVYSYDASYCVDATCEIAIAETFMGLDRVWTLANSNLVLTGATATVWLDTRAPGVNADGHPAHRFYAMGANTDADADGLSDGFELFVTKTQSDESDTDGDGLPDGWEVENDLDPNNSGGDDGGDGDSDGDGLSNAEEFQARSNPRSFDLVIDLNSQFAVTEGRSIYVSQEKCGFTEYINPSTPPKFYLAERQIESEYCDIDLCAQTVLWYTNMSYSVYDPQSGSVSGTTTSLYTWVSTEEEIHCMSAGWSVDYADILVPLSCQGGIWQQCMITNDSVYKLYSEISGPVGGGAFDCDGWHADQPNRIESLRTRQLQDEYTTAMLHSSAIAALDRWSVWDSLEWGQQRSLILPGPDEPMTNQVVLVSSFDMSPNETNITYRRLQFRFAVMDTTQAVYRVRWIELYHPEDTNQPSEVKAVRSAVVKGSGSMQDIYSPEFILDPPSEDGWIEVVVLKVDLELKNSGTIVVSPENEDYAAEKAAAGGTDQLGELPMGQGRGDFPGQAYTSPIMAISTVSPAGLPSGIEFQWKRYITRRSWFIRQDGGTNWVVTQRSRRGVPTPDDDTGAADFNDPTPSTTASKLYMYDNSALLPASGPGSTLPVGDYIREEKAFSYVVEYRPTGGAWSECSRMDVGQIIVTKRIDITGNIAQDWEGIENSNEKRTLNATIAETEVRSMVGGSLPITIDPAANN